MLVLQDIYRNCLPLVLDQVIELGHGLTGGRLWDLRLAESKLSRRLKDNDDEPIGNEEVVDTLNAVDDDKRTEAVPKVPLTQQDLKMVCRPLVGDRIRGGGFLAVWKKLKKDQ